MSLENQNKQVIEQPKKVEDPRLNTPRPNPEPGVFEQTCIVPDLHPMKNLTALKCEEIINFDM